tara:strand:+ start:127 stop:762 length:636 start_codon:yes stop_codon:yes gene_type:complete
MHTLTLASQKQLVDLNEDRTLFDIEVAVTAEDPTEQFEAVILSQTELDSGEVNYQVHPGAMEARLVNDKNIYQNYFLCVRGTKGKKVNIVIKHNPPPPEAVEEEAFTEPEEDYVDESEIMPIPLPPLLPKKVESSIFSLRSLFIVVIIVGIGIGLYFLWKGGKTTAAIDLSTTQPVSIIPAIPLAAALPAVISSKKASSPNLMSRLNKMVQ